MAVQTASAVTLAVVSGGRRFVFAQPIEVEVTHPDSTWTYRHPATGMNSYGLTRAEAEENFASDVAHCWDSYVMKADDQLASRALKLKTQLQELIAAIEPA